MPKDHDRERPAPEDAPGTLPDAGSGMIPMIDVVFQLLLFFLLSLRFATVDERIDARLPRELGLSSRPADDDPRPRIVVRLDRRDLDRPGAEPVTRVRVASGPAWDLPAADRAPGERAAALGVLVDRLARARRAAGTAGVPRAVVATRGAGGGAVPHGDVVSVLDAFLAAGLTDVTFEGRRLPGRAGP